MLIVEPKVEKITEENPFKKIEIAGRICYKSESSISDDSAIKFYDRLVKSQHTAMLEHATFIFSVPYAVYNLAKQCGDKSRKEGNLGRYLNCTCVTNSKLETRYIVSGNLRAINESGIPGLIGCLCFEGPGDGKLAYEKHDFADYQLKYASENVHLIRFEDIANPTPAEIAVHKYTTMKFITNRGVTHEFVRHRPFSFAQESTRYVNYNKEKFGSGNIQFIKPAKYDEYSEKKKELWLRAAQNSEDDYNALIEEGATAQEARDALNHAVKTEFIVTGNDAEWQHFFNLRSKGTTGAPHPDIKIIADMALELY